MSADEDIFSREQLVEAFDVTDVLSNPARFDVKKAEAINGTHVRMLEAQDFRDRLVPYLKAASLVGAELTARENEILDQAAPLVQERIALLGEATDMLEFLFKSDDEIVIDEKALKGMPANLVEVVEATVEALEGVSEWNAEAIQVALRAKLVDELELKPRQAFGPARVAISGKRVSPPLFESMEILGRESSLKRLRAFGESR